VYRNPHALALRLLIPLLLLCAPPAGADDDTDALLAALADIRQLQGEFQQRQFDAGGALLAESGGVFRLLRPGYFAWEILTPDSQLIVAGPEYLWHYDRDLETVTRRPVDSGDHMAPLKVLGTDGDALRQAFRVVREDPDTYNLVPLADEAGFEQLRLRLQDGLPAAMEIQDSLQQEVRVVFRDVGSAPALEAADFHFEPPEGVDLFIYDE